MCQRTTSAVTFMFSSLGFACTNYIDAFGGAEVPANSTQAFNALDNLLLDLGLQSSPDKDSPSSTSMVFLGVLFNTEDMTISGTPDRVSDLLTQCKAVLLTSSLPVATLRSLLGVMSFVTACVRPARIFTVCSTVCGQIFTRVSVPSRTTLNQTWVDGALFFLGTTGSPL